MGVLPQGFVLGRASSFKCCRFAWRLETVKNRQLMSCAKLFALISRSCNSQAKAILALAVLTGGCRSEGNSVFIQQPA